MPKLKGKIIDSWEALLKILPPIQEHRQWIFRGQSDHSWHLQTSLERHFDYIKFHIKKLGLSEENQEYRMLRSFQNGAGLYINNMPPEGEHLECLALMQHYGCPTRMLDFSFSPFVALFFAASEGIDDFSLYLIPVNRVSGHDEVARNFILKYSRRRPPVDDAVFAWEPRIVSERQLFQQSLFLCPTSIRTDIEETIRAQGRFFRPKKLIFPKERRWDFLRELNRMNINKASLFPGRQGFCESLKTQPLYRVGTLGRLNVS